MRHGADLGVVSTEVLMMADEVECDSGENSLEQSLVLSVWKCTSPQRQKMFTKPGTSLGETTAVSTNPIRPVCQEVRE
jgi:hypothetical protein